MVCRCHITLEGVEATDRVQVDGVTFSQDTSPRGNNCRRTRCLSSLSPVSVSTRLTIYRSSTTTRRRANRCSPLRAVCHSPSRSVSSPTSERSKNYTSSLYSCFLGCNQTSVGSSSNSNNSSRTMPSGTDEKHGRSTRMGKRTPRRSCSRGERGSSTGISGRWC